MIKTRHLTLILRYYYFFCRLLQIQNTLMGKKWNKTRNHITGTRKIENKHPFKASKTSENNICC
jgi:hypothetical protein